MKKTSEHITFESMGTIDRITEEFLFVENPESMPGPGLILQTKPPFLLGKVVNFKTREEMKIYLTRKGGLGFIKNCPGYLVCVIPIEPLMYSETIMNNEVIRAYEGMANFYLEKKIKRNEGYYKRYREKTDS